MNTFFHADHVGSLLRPQALKDAARAFFGKRIDKAQFDAALDDAIRGAVAMQEDAGLQSITDGEFRRGSWFSGFIDAVQGLGVREALFTFHGEGGGVKYETAHVEGKLKHVRGIATHEFAFLRSVTKRRPKITLPAPSLVHFFRGDATVDRAAYPNLDDFWSDLVAVYHEEVRQLAALGCDYVQLDEVGCAMLCDPRRREEARRLGLDPDALIDTYVSAINAIADARPKGMTIAVHVCRGNYKGHWMAEGGYAPIAETFFGGVRVDTLFLEYDSARAGGFEPLRHVSGDKNVVLGLVSSKTAALENPADLLRRIDEASKFIDRERLGLSPQCGFASSVGGNPLTIDDEAAKLRLVCDTARRAWG
jgi:5-methyltetrahydropteroyltriglutamate--homocysteine methyltransferase